MNQEEFQKIVDLCGTLVAVDKHLGLKRGIAAYWVKKNKWNIVLDPSRRKKRTSHLEQYIPLLKHLAELGWSCNRIASVLGMPGNDEGVRKYLIQLGVNRNHTPGGNGERAATFVDGDYDNRKDDAYIFVPAPVGYKGRTKSNGWVAEHRLVAEKKLGRLLQDKEVVHHLDLEGKNNKPENLMVFPSNKEHLQYHWEQTQKVYAERLRRLQLADLEYIQSLGWRLKIDDPMTPSQSYHRRK